MSERVGERLEPSLEREGAGGRLKPLLKDKKRLVMLVKKVALERVDVSLKLSLRQSKV